MFLVDTNVLLDIATRDPQWFAWSSTRLAPLVNSRQAAINPVIYAEQAFHETFFLNNLRLTRLCGGGRWLSCILLYFSHWPGRHVKHDLYG
jgi:hypothetical protein